MGRSPANTIRTSTSVPNAIMIGALPGPTGATRRTNRCSTTCCWAPSVYWPAARHPTCPARTHSWKSSASPATCRPRRTRAQAQPAITRPQFQGPTLQRLRPVPWKRRQCQQFGCFWCRGLVSDPNTSGASRSGPWAITKAPAILGTTNYGTRAWEYANPGGLSSGGPGPTNAALQALIPSQHPEGPFQSVFGV